jgi:hypothetical protein
VDGGYILSIGFSLNKYLIKRSGLYKKAAQINGAAFYV